jgi:hypothetical protein
MTHACARIASVALLLCVACGDGAAPPDATDSRARPAADTPSAVVPTRTSARTDSLTLVFTRDETAAPVTRAVPATSTPVRTALEMLVRGPTAAEHAAGIRSWFSGETADVVRLVAIDSTGHAVIDFHDLRRVIPNASSSAGSALLLTELNGTIFQFPEIRSVEYRIDGSCAAFWEWLQYDCHVVTRQGP